MPDPTRQQPREGDLLLHSPRRSGRSPITYFRTLDEQASRSLNTERMLATLSVGFGTLALLLSLVGLYGVMSFVVTQRTREIGIRPVNPTAALRFD
jgi:hypothetical protein